MRPSLDGVMLAVQRSPAFLQFVHVRSSKMFVQVLRPCYPSPDQHAMYEILLDCSITLQGPKYMAHPLTCCL